MNSDLFISKVETGKLQLTGEDRVRFLNGQTTNDIKSIPINTGSYTFFTNAKGKIRSDGIVLNTGENLFVQVQAGLTSSLLGELDKYLIADDVQMEDVSKTWKSVTILGEHAIEIVKGIFQNLTSLESVFHMAQFNGILAFRSRRSLSSSYDVWIPEEKFESTYASLLEKTNRFGGGECSAEQLEILRIEAGIPQFGIDFSDSYLAPETGLEAMGISYKKGCYLGQEVIARIKSIGHVNRMIRSLKLTHPAAAGEKLYRENKEVGTLTSCVVSPRFGPIALGTVRNEPSQSPILYAGGEASIVETFIQIPQ